MTNGPADEADLSSAPVSASTSVALVLDDPTSMPSRTVDRAETIFHSGGVPVCGNCGRPHPTAGEVRDCYARSSEHGAAEARGRRQLKGDGANEVTAKFLRATMPASEAALWRHLQPTFEGYRFSAQVLMLGYSLDFYCHRLALAIEVDGGSHRGRDRADQLREDDLRANHVDVVRIAAELVLHDIEHALDVISTAVEERARLLERRRRQPVEPAPFMLCRHNNDSLLCERCKIVDREMAERQARREVRDEPPPKRSIPSGPSRYSREPGLVNRPPEPPGTVSKRGF